MDVLSLAPGSAAWNCCSGQRTTFECISLVFSKTHKVTGKLTTGRERNIVSVKIYWLPEYKT